MNRWETPFTVKAIKCIVICAMLLQPTFQNYFWPVIVQTSFILGIMGHYVSEHLYFDLNIIESECFIRPMVCIITKSIALSLGTSPTM